MIKHIRTFFYTVKCDEDIAAALLRINAISSEEGRNWEYKEGMARLRVLRQENGLIVGDMMRIRLHEPAIVARVSGGERDVLKDGNEGMGETNAFLYCPGSHHLAYQSNRSGITAGCFASYIREKGHIGSSVDLDPVVNEAKIEQLRGKERPRKIRVRIAVPKIADDSAAKGSFGDVVAAANALHSSQMEILFGMTRKDRHSLDKNGVLTWVQRVLKMREDGNPVTALEVVTEGVEGKASEVLDFLDAALKVVDEIEPSQLLNEFYERRLACVREAWQVQSRTLRWV